MTKRRPSASAPGARRAPVRASPGRKRPAGKTGASARSTTKSLNLALQGGGAHGAFSWGVIDALLEDGRIGIEGISATSAGSLNAVVLAHGLARGDRDRARAALDAFWKSVAASARFNPWRMPGLSALFGDLPLEYSPFYWAFETVTRTLSPYQFNPLGLNPLRDVLAQAVDFEALRASAGPRLYLCATNVESGKIRIFERSEVTIESVLASACLPQLFQAVEIDGEHYWDGGYLGNPAIFPLIYGCESADVMVVHINPIERPGVPRSAPEIANRINEISFNSSLMREMRAISFVTRLIDSGKIAPGEMKLMRMHSIRADELMSRFGVASKIDPEWSFLCQLRDLGRAQAAEWLSNHFKDLGVRSSIDIEHEFL